ncbi:hypothetical protein [Flavobacterium difficile]|uniref:Uncharacterized protein n=1 Tax=Flavobacterium difficile TaxID=2709659 RepID=A0ABX0I032_9FLAO|nr:hypothetical protein [Flavobacterium difficile]NHM00558.1 hypothetical protein [Flavobacterium difficile]
MEKKRLESFNQIDKAWVLNVPASSPEVNMVLNSWQDWQSFEQEIKQKPKSTISAFKLKVLNLVSKSDSLHLNVPPRFNLPQVRSRIVALQTKILALDTYFSLDIVPEDKVQNLIAAINKEIIAFHMQCEEIIVKSNIPTEIGEPKIISISDTTRNAKAINFDELEQKDILEKDKSNSKK